MSLDFYPPEIAIGAVADSATRKLLEKGYLPQLAARCTTLVCRRTDARRAFSGSRDVTQLRMTHKASIVVGVVLQRNLHRVAAAFKPQFEGLSGHWVGQSLPQFHH